MRQIKTKNIQISLKTDSFKPFLKLILFNDKMCYLNRWLANCKINQNMVRSTRLAIRRTIFFIVSSIISIPYDPIQISPVHDPRQISEVQLSLQSRRNICPTLEFPKTSDKETLESIVF